MAKIDATAIQYNDNHLVDFDRSGKITASLVAAILGIDPYTSRQKAWRKIMGLEKYREPWIHQRRGMENECHAIADFEVATGQLLHHGCFVSHPTISWIGASPDGLARDETHGHCIPVEVKCPVILHTSVPPHYFAQVQTQIECLDAPYGWFFSWTEYESSLPMKVERDRAWWSETLLVLEGFYTEFVLGNCQPPRRKKS